MQGHIYPWVNVQQPSQLTLVSPYMYLVKILVTYQQQALDLPLLVVKGVGPSLMGRDWLLECRLNWQQVYKLNVSDKLEELLEKHATVFSGDQGSLNTTEAKLYIKEGAKPQFF